MEVRVRAGRWADSAKMMAAARAAEAVDGVERGDRADLVLQVLSLIHI